MVKRFLLFILLFSLSSTQLQAQNQTLSAFVDRTDITFNDVITLTVRVDAQLGNAVPGFTGLDRDFEQLGLSRNSTYSNNNGNVQSWTEYRISIKPKSTGRLTIPSFRVGGQVTVPITINVGEAPQVSSSGNDEIFITTSVDKSDIYVQEQLLYTIKLYYTIGFDQGAQLTSPQVDSAVVQQLGSDETYQEIVDGIRYNVTERKFVIFPQASGELTIPPIYFTATVGRRGGLSRILSNRASVRDVSLTSDIQVINVKATPASFPAGATWLPSPNFTLEEVWSAALDSLDIGESITRNLILTAPGLSSSLLPELEYQDMNNLKFYPDQPSREDLADVTGVTGKRTEGTAIVPSAAGDYLLPSIEIPWWNTQTDSLEIASIPARTISVLPGIDTLINSQTQTSIAPLSNEAPGTFNKPAESLNETSSFSFYWISATILFAAAWLFSTVMWLRNRNMLQQVGTADFVPVMADNNFKQRSVEKNTALVGNNQLPDLKTAYRVLQKASEQSNLIYLKRSLLAWAQAFFQDRTITTLDHLNYQADMPELTPLLEELEKSLYSQNASQDYSAKALFEMVTSLHRSKKPTNKQGKDYSLPPLYKN